MRIKTASTLITFVVTFLIATTLCSLWIAVTSFEQRRQAQIRHNKITIAEYELLNAIHMASDNAKAYLVTGNRRFKQAYDHEITQHHHIQSAYQKLQRLNATTEQLVLAQQILQYAQQLNEIEQTAITHFEKYGRTQGLAVLYGPTYNNMHDQVISSINTLKAKSNLLEQQDIARLTRKANQQAVIMLVIMVISIAISISAMIFFYHRRVALPLDRITSNLKRLVAKGQNVDFSDKYDMQEIAELAHVLDNYHHLYSALEEEKLKLEYIKSELQTIIDAAPVGVVKIKNRIIERSNYRADELLGYHHGEMLGHQTRIWYGDDETFLRVGTDVMVQMSKHEPYVREAQWVRKDGSLLWARISARAINYDDPAKGLVVIIEDITKDREAAEALLKAKIMAEDMARTKAEFLANMSHEIRTPMNAIIGLTHLLLKSNLDEKQHDYMLKIQSASQHLLSVINDILDYSKIEAGKINIESMPFELQEVINNVVSLINEKAADKGLKVIVSIPADVPQHLVGDPLRIAQVLINYANNAVKFTSHGEIDINATVIKRVHDQIWLRIAVRDTGIGLSQEQMSHLFQSFTQIDASTTRRYGGSGLGLSIAKQLTELMGGEVGVESEVDVGSTFWFVVPLKLFEEYADALLPAPNLRKRHVLVLESSVDDAELLCHQLKRMTFVVTNTTTSETALKLLTQANKSHVPYEIVFVAWQITATGCNEFIQQLRALSLSHQPQIVITSHVDTPEIGAAANSLHVAELLITPVSASQLFNVMMRLLGGQALTPDADYNIETDLSTIVGTRVLLVEDNDLNLEVESALLRDAGFVVDVATDGAIALDKVQRAPYDVILMDVQMPVMDGLTATREIRKLKIGKEIPIIAMTASAMLIDQQRCLAAGMNDHVAKPVNPEDLWRKLLKWVKPLSTEAARSATPIAVAPEVFLVHELGLDTITTLAVEKGLKNTMGKQALYVSLLKKFVSTESSFAQRMQKALSSHDMATAELLAHTLKSVAAQIGAEEIRALAQQLEQAIRERKALPQVRRAVEQIAQALSTLIAAINAKIYVDRDKPMTANVEVQIDVATLTDICQQLAVQLKNADFKSSHFLDTHERYLAAAFGDRFGPISQAVYNFDYAEALALLSEAVKPYAIQLNV